MIKRLQLRGEMYRIVPADGNNLCRRCRAGIPFGPQRDPLEFELPVRIAIGAANSNGINWTALCRLIGNVGVTLVTKLWYNSTSRNETKTTPLNRSRRADSEHMHFMLRKRKASIN